ncbi:MAG: DNA topoisomerase, partial [Candidatus Kapaibacterium sp.]
LASQMSDAQLEKTTATILISTTPERLVATGEVLTFDGFLKVYMESQDEDNDIDEAKMLPPLSVQQRLPLRVMHATQKFTRPPARYTEASLVKRLEELGIGRPSTYAPTISTIQRRGYVVKEDREGKQRDVISYALMNDTVTKDIRPETYASEKSKLFPTDIGVIVTDFLIQHFDGIMDYGFTAAVEEKFDEIARGQLQWNEMLKEFYTPFHSVVEKTMEGAQRQTGERHLGVDPASGRNLYARMGRYGAYV